MTLQSGIRVVGLIALVAATATPASAQVLQGVDLSAGYQFLKISNDNFDEADVDTSLSKGWYADVSGNLNEWLAAVGQISGNYQSDAATVTIGGVTTTAEYDLSVHTFLGGARLSSRRNQALTPFAQVLAGFARTGFSGTASASSGGTPIFGFDADESSTDFAMQFGGGVTLNVGERFGLRLAADYLRVFGEDSGLNAFRFALGAVIPLSRP